MISEDTAFLATVMISGRNYYRPSNNAHCHSHISIDCSIEDSHFYKLNQTPSPSHQHTSNMNPTNMINEASPKPSPTSSIGSSDAKIYMSTTPAVLIALPSVQKDNKATFSNLFRPRKREVHPFAFAEEILALVDEEDADEDDTARRLAQACQA